MNAEIKGSAAFSYLDVDLEPGEEITAESNAMASMSADVDIRSRLNGGFFKGLLRKFLGGETLFLNHFINKTDGTRRVTLVQKIPGQIACLELDNDTFYLQPGAFLACDKGIKIGLRWAGIVSGLGREGLFKMVVSGSGKVWYGAYGSLLERQIDGEYIVDTGHLVAYGPGIRLKLQLSGGFFSSLFGGEGLVTRLEGKDIVVLQTRSLPGLASWINPKLLLN
ncbi:MAG: TIGR00266 family protein [Desulfobacterales bacterium]|nr:MAG: TIGR00266 family protein [Desulfobacterales bacterium]